jgi:hypothetical protein
LPLLVGLVHAAIVAPRYHVGSFDDDASYILTAKALLAGHGLTGHLASGEVVVGLYPPGYSAVLAPFVWLWPHSFVPLRLLSLACFASVFPLTWVYLGRHRISPAGRAAVLLVLALGPPFATYATMVMAETPFLVLLLLLLLVADRWSAEARAVTWTGATVVLLAAALIWFKQAGIALVAGLILWLPFSRAARRWAKAAALAGGVGVTLVPVIVARMAAGIPLAGSRYSQELGGFYQGGLLHRLRDVVPGSTLHLLASAIPATLVPYLEPLPIQGHWADLWKVLSWHVTILIAIGAATWMRRFRDAAVPMVVLYLAESVLWPFVNERRAILVLPLLAAWYVAGAARIWQWVRQKRPVRPQLSVLASAGAALAALAVVAPLVAQIPRDYLFAWGQSSSHFGGSRYVAVLRQLGRPADVVETDYRSSTALFTGHATNWDAFIVSLPPVCYEPALLTQLGVDRAGYLLLGDLNKPGVIDNGCVQSIADPSSWAEPILHTGPDDATVYELIGPDTGHPNLMDALTGSTPSSAARGSQYSVTWTLARPTPVSQLSVGQAAAVAGPTTGVQLQVEGTDGIWSVMAAATGGVGDGPAQAPFLLRSPTSPVLATAVRVTVEGPAAAAGTDVSDVAVIGPARS